MKEELVAMKKLQEKKSKMNDEDPNLDLSNMEPKLKEAYIKMRKLDKILAKKMKREKQVKRERILLQKK